MSRIFITPLPRFIDEHGVTPPTLPRAEKKLAQYICKIVTQVTHPPTHDPKAYIPCWSRLNNKKCTGKIAAGIDLKSFNILWQCLVCGNHGTISKWEHSVLDQGYRA